MISLLQIYHLPHRGGVKHDTEHYGVPAMSKPDISTPKNITTGTIAHQEPKLQLGGGHFLGLYFAVVRGQSHN